MMTKRGNILMPLLFAGLLCLAGGIGCRSAAPIGADVERRVHVRNAGELEQLPRIIGGYEALEAAKEYPAQAREEEAAGVIWVQCRVTARGWPTRIQIAKGGHFLLESEARRVVQQLRFEPARKNGATIPVTAYIPVIFQRPSPEGEGEG